MFDEEQEEFYQKHYQPLMGSGLISRAWRLIHNQMEKNFAGDFFPVILEIGAGNGEHFGSAKCNFDTYYCTDIRVENLCKLDFGDANVLVKREDVGCLSFSDSTFDRVIMTCVLAHLVDPLEALSEIRRVARHDSYISIYLPCEPGLILRIARSFSTHAKAKRLKISNIEVLHFVEHKNYYLALDKFIRYIFRDDSVTRRRYPFRFLSWNFNLYSLYTIKISKGGIRK